MTADDDELTTRILQRAQFAQLARNLKLNLSKIPQISQSNSTSPLKRKKNILVENNNDDNDDLDNTSPTKKQSISPLRNSNSDKNAIPNVIPSTPRANKHDKEEVGSNDNPHDGGADLLLYLATSPYSHPNNQSNNNSTNSNNNINNNNNNINSNNRSKFKIPTTPLHSSNLDSDTQPIRFSNLKNSLTSPQSTLKLTNNLSHFNQHNNNINSTPNLSFNDILLDSPALYLNNDSNTNSITSNAHSTLSPKRTTSNILNHNQTTDSSNTPTTPSRELTSNSNNNNDKITATNNETDITAHNRNNLTDTLMKSSLSIDKHKDRDKDKIIKEKTTTTNSNNNSNNLLKTPNFNMGDYIHNLFSPSPRFNPTTNNLRRASINSLTTVAFLNNTLNINMAALANTNTGTTTTNTNTDTNTKNTNTTTTHITNDNRDNNDNTIKADKLESNNGNI